MGKLFGKALGRTDKERSTIPPRPNWDSPIFERCCPANTSTLRMTSWIILPACPSYLFLLMSSIYQVCPFFLASWLPYQEHQKGNVLLFSLCSFLFLLFSFLFAPCPMLYALCSLPFVLCPMPHALCPMLFALCPLSFALCSLPFVLCPLPFALFSLPYAPCPMLYALCSMLYALCPLLHALCSMLYALFYLNRQILQL